jgi:hypothetical protein
VFDEFTYPVILLEVSVIVHDEVWAAAVVIVARSECDPSPAATVYLRALAAESEVATAEVSTPAAVPSIEVYATSAAETAVNVVPIDDVTADDNVPEPVAVTVTDSLVAAELSRRK